VGEPRGESTDAKHSCPFATSPSTLPAPGVLQKCGGQPRNGHYLARRLRRAHRLACMAGRRLLCATKHPASNKPLEPAALDADPTNKIAISCAFFGLTLYDLVSVGFAARVLMFVYGLVVLVFRYAFGIELPLGRFS
jgi:hypothetical protein